MFDLFVTAQLIFVLSSEIALITFVIYVNLLGQPLLLLVNDQVLLSFSDTNYVSRSRPPLSQATPQPRPPELLMLVK